MGPGRWSATTSRGPDECWWRTATDSQERCDKARSRHVSALRGTNSSDALLSTALQEGLVGGRVKLGRVEAATPYENERVGRPARDLISRRAVTNVPGTRAI